MRVPPPLPLLAVEQLTVGYRRGQHIRPVATQLQFQASPGQIIALLGPNGCGKSTLLRTLAGMQPALEGRVLLNGHLLTNFTPPQRATQLAVVQLLLRLAHEHQKTVLLSTHALDLALLMADRLWLLQEGKLQSGVPEDMVLGGAVAAVFESEGIAFDRQTGTFAPPRAAGPPIRVEGFGLEALWTQRALERSGYTVVADTGRTPAVRVVAGPPRRWVIESAAAPQDEPSIEGVLAHLATLKRH